jgi:hypothetical protein
MSGEFNHRPFCGWRGIDAVQQAFACQYPKLAQAAPHLFGAPAPTSPVLLYKAYWDVLGKDPGYPAQQIGDCVSFGHAHGNDLLQCIEVGLATAGLAQAAASFETGTTPEFRETDTEFIYGESRKVAGILGSDDGSYGAAAVKAMTTVGMVSREMLGAVGGYSGKRAKEWGDSGPPAASEAEAAPFKLGNAANVTTWDELVAAITNGYPVTICTGQGFNLSRDADGFCRAVGTWGHCMLIAGVRFDRPGACILQSWGPDVPSGPTALAQPTWSFWAEQKVVESILAEGDSWALSKAPAFVVRPLPPSWKYDETA